MRNKIARFHPLVSALCIAGMLIVIWSTWIAPLPSRADRAAQMPRFLPGVSPSASVSGLNLSEQSRNQEIDPPVDGTDKTCTPEWTPAVNFEFEQRVIELVNAERGAAGLPPLKSSPALTQTARYHAADMGIDDYFSHDSKDRLDEELLTICSYQTRIGNAYTGGQWIGENIAEGYHSPEGVVAAWMASEVHRDNILNERFWEIGAGYYRSATAGNREYWALDFGKRFNRFPLVINAEATFTDSPKVILYVYGDWKEMRLRNDSGSWTKWQPFLNSIKWQIPNEPGEHEVIVELRSGSLRSSSSDMIRLAGENSQK